MKQMQNIINKKDNDIISVKKMLDSTQEQCKTLEEVIKDNNIHINKFKAREEDLEKRLAD
jgi:ADP-dependent phosphofructokinase/glucokinase